MPGNRLYMFLKDQIQTIKYKIAKKKDNWKNAHKYENM